MGEGWLVLKLMKSRNGNFLVGISEQIWRVRFCKYTRWLPTLDLPVLRERAIAPSIIEGIRFSYRGTSLRRALV